ncbi:MAG: hypothetical protein VX528_03060 [Candidatus Latescibacterota bacterium]|nr:hypothetical protein [Candidatus Latescibacterota bacterium]
MDRRRVGADHWPKEFCFRAVPYVQEGEDDGASVRFFQHMRELAGAPGLVVGFFTLLFFAGFVYWLPYSAQSISVAILLAIWTGASIGIIYPFSKALRRALTARHELVLDLRSNSVTCRRGCHMGWQTASVDASDVVIAVHSIELGARYSMVFFTGYAGIVWVHDLWFPICVVRDRERAWEILEREFGARIGQPIVEGEPIFGLGTPKLF